MVKFLICFLLLIFPFGQLTRLPLSRGETNIYFHDLIIVFLIFFWFFKNFFRKKKFFLPRLTKFILAPIVIFGFSLVLVVPYFQTRELVISSLYLFRWISYAGLYFILVDVFKTEKNFNFKSLILNLLILSGVTGAVLGFFQYCIFPDIRALTAYDWDPHYYRIVGAYFDPGYTGIILVLTLILILEKIWQKREKRLVKKLIFALVYLALAFTYARSAFLAYLVAMAIFSWYKKSAKFFLAVFLIGVITIFLLPRPGGEGVKLERQSTAWARINNWRQTIKVGYLKPVFGWGFNSYRYTQRNLGLLDQDNWQQTNSGAGADSSLLFIFATTGLSGLISYFYLGRGILKNKNLVVLSSLGALLTHSFFNNSLFYAWVMIWVWILLAIKENS